MKSSLAPSMSSSRVVTARDPKGTKFVSIVEAAYNKAGLSEKEAQRVNDTSGLSALIESFIAENRLTDKFKNEEVSSNYGYLSGYKKPNDLIEQLNCLHGLFPGLCGDHPDFSLYGNVAQVLSGKVVLPNDTEGWFAIPNIWKFGGLPIFGETYSEAFQKVLDAIKKTRKGKFHNYREGQINEKRLRQSARTKEFFEKLSETQGHPDILIVPAQFGIRHRGRSVRRAREVMLDVSSEFGLGAFAVGIMLLTHPERLKDLNDLWIDCSGDEFDDPDSDVRFGRAPCFSFDGDRVRFGTRGVDDASGHYGTASGVLPQ